MAAPARERYAQPSFAPSLPGNGQQLPLSGLELREARAGSYRARSGPGLGFHQLTRQATRVHVSHVGGDQFFVNAEPSDKAVLWSELFQDSERKLIRKLIHAQMVGFTLHEVYQISVRSLRPPDTPEGQPLVVLLHGLSGRLTTSWAWAKMICPLLHEGFSVIMVDFPGFGRSSMRQCFRAPVAAWLHEGWKILFQVLLTLSAERRPLRFVAYGETCRIVIHYMQTWPHHLEKEHIFLDPIFDVEDFCLKSPACTDGRQFEAIWQVVQKYRIWATYGDDMAKESQVARTILSRFITPPSDVGRCVPRVVLSRVPREHCCTAQAARDLPEQLLIISRFLRRSYARFLTGGFVPPANMPDVNHAESAAPSECETRTSHETLAAMRGMNAMTTLNWKTRSTSGSKLPEMPLQAAGVSSTFATNQLAETASAPSLVANVCLPPVSNGVQLPSVKDRPGNANVRAAMKAAERFAAGEPERERSALLTNCSHVRRHKRENPDQRPLNDDYRKFDLSGYKDWRLPDERGQRRLFPYM